MSVLAQVGPGDLAHDVVWFADQYVGDALEVAADELASGFMESLPGSMEASQREAVEVNFAHQLLELRTLIADLRRERRALDPLQVRGD